MKYDKDGRLIRGLKKGLAPRGNKLEKEMTNKFAEFFGITYVSEETLKISKYVINFLQPDNDYRKKFNLSNEFLLLFSRYNSFDTRSFDLVDKVLEKFSNRLDKLCVFILSNDNNIHSTIKKKVSDQQDFRLIVPFTYSEVLSDKFDENFLVKRLQEYLYHRDLFSFSSPLTSDEFFYGRSQIVQKLYSDYSNGAQSGLFGLRKIGKTSVLFALQRTIKHRNGKSIYIECQSPTVHANKWYQLLEYIIKDIANKYQSEYNTTTYLANLDYNKQNAASLFEAHLLDLYEIFEKHRILLIFDEIENITYSLSPNVNWREGLDYLYFWQTIRSIIQRYPKLISFTLAGVNPHIVDMTTVDKYDNPIFSMVSSSYLDFFGLSEVKQMVSKIGGYMGLSFDEEIYTYLVEDYGGHPFLVRQVCSMINKLAISKPYHFDKFTYKKYKIEFDRNIIPYVELIICVLKDWYPNEFELLSILSSKGSEKFLEHKISKQSEINHLVGYGILIEKGSHFTITINAIREYLIQNFKDTEIPDKMDERWAMISRRRNQIELTLRNTVKITLNSAKGKGNAKNSILGILPTEKRIRNIDKTTDYLLENVVFFKELMEIVNKNWPLFEKLFIDKEKFTMCMEAINKYRIDAHAKSISDDQYFLVMYSIDWIEEKLY